MRARVSQIARQHKTHQQYQLLTLIFERFDVPLHAQFDFAVRDLEFVELRRDIDEGAFIFALAVDELPLEGVGIRRFDIFESGERLAEGALVRFDFGAARGELFVFGTIGREEIEIGDVLGEEGGLIGGKGAVIEGMFDGVGTGVGELHLTAAGDDELSAARAAVGHGEGDVDGAVCWDGGRDDVSLVVCDNIFGKINGLPL